ncbi:MAG: beta-galactosidase GalB [Muribaculaceae bacterium]
MNKYSIYSSIVLLLVCCAASALAAEQPAGREIENFDWDWRFARFGLQADGTRVDEPSNIENIDYADASWRLLDLPHDWAIEGPFRTELDGYTGKLPWRGIGWYRKHFEVSDADKGKRFYIDFDGAMANAEVWINGHMAGGRPYGYISFRVDISDYLLWGKENVVAVRLDTEHWGSRWYPGAGIYRHVRLVKTNQMHIAHWGVFVTTPVIADSYAEAKVQVKVENHNSETAACSFIAEIFEIDADDVVHKKVASSKGNVKPMAGNGGVNEDSVFIKVKNPKLWSIVEPNRYMVRVTLYDKSNRMIDVYDQPFGFRTIEFTHNNGFLLNGNRVPINGTCNHHDLGALGAAVNTEALRRQLNILKSFGCNALRTSHNPPSPDLLTLADKMGFVVMDEAFDCWQHGKKEYDYGYLFDQWHEKDLESLVCRDRNHPSVIMWSTGNEVHEQYYPEQGMAWHLTQVVHRFDTTRPVTFGASYPSKSALNGTELQVDVHGMNYAAGVYGGPDFYGDFLNKPGHEHLSGYSSESSSTMSSRGEYFPRRFHVSSYDNVQPGWGGLVDEEFAALDRYPGICGEFVWTGFDYLGEPTPFNSDESVLLNHSAAVSAEELEKQRRKLEEIEKNRPTSRSSYFGIVDLAGFPKDRYYLYQSRWMPDHPMVHILPHWNFDENRIGKITPVYVYTSGDEAELFLNGKSLGRKKKDKFQYRLKWDSVQYQPGELRAVAYKQGKLWASAERCTTGEAQSISLTPHKQSLKADGYDLVMVRVALTDSQGREVPTAEPLLKCSLQGPGKIVATDNGDPTCLQIFSQTERKAFNGLMLVIVKANRGAKGKLMLTVQSDGIESCTLPIEIE